MVNLECLTYYSICYDCSGSLNVGNANPDDQTSKQNMNLKYDCPQSRFTSNIGPKNVCNISMVLICQWHYITYIPSTTETGNYHSILTLKALKYLIMPGTSYFLFSLRLRNVQSTHFDSEILPPTSCNRPSILRFFSCTWAWASIFSFANSSFSTEIFSLASIWLLTDSSS